MVSARTCASDLATPSHPSPSTAPDVLRKERFGALWYRRSDCSTEAIPPGPAILLASSTQESILTQYARQGGVPGLDDQAFSLLVASWRREGMLDAGFRCTAQVVDTPRTHPALTAPLVTHVELTRACNLRCAHCYMDVVASPARDELPAARWSELFAELKQLGAPLLVLAGGEPLLRPDLERVLDGLAQHQLDAWLCTNATLVDETRARQLAASPLRGYSISLDGPDAESHDRLRGRGQFDRAMRGIAHLIAAGAHDVKLRVTVTPAVANRLLEFAPLATRLGVHRVVFKPFSQLGEASAAHDLVVPRRHWQRVVKRVRDAWPETSCPADLSDGIPTRAPAWLGVSPGFGCIAGTTTATVTHDGRVLGCGSLRPDNAWSLHHHTLTECWAESPAVTMWRQLEPGASCAACDDLVTCAGACRARAMASGGIRGRDPWMGCAGEHASG
ncbi:MAG: radical SAM protein [Pseudomonadota bacterium]